MSLNLSEPALLKRNGSFAYAETWSHPSYIGYCPKKNIDERFLSNTEKMVDAFVDDYLRGNADNKAEDAEK